jgi:hypothetical protein
VITQDVMEHIFHPDRAISTRRQFTKSA